jgi:hypothetical protein
VTGVSNTNTLLLDMTANPISTFLTPPDPSELPVLERVLLKLGTLNTTLKLVSKAVREAVEGRGLIAATHLILQASYQAKQSEFMALPRDIYCALYNIALPDITPWAETARAVHLARKLDAALAQGPTVRLASFLRLVPALPPIDGQNPTPRLYRAFELLRLACASSGRQVECWGAFPFALMDTGLTPLPCPALTLTHQRLRLERFDAIIVRKQLMDRLERQIEEILALSTTLAQAEVQMSTVLLAAHKPAQLTRLAALLLKLPLVSPALVGGLLGLDLRASGLLCRRAEEIGLLHLLTDRQSWKCYAAVLVDERYGCRLMGNTQEQVISRSVSERSGLAAMTMEIDTLLNDLETLIPTSR